MKNYTITVNGTVYDVTVEEGTGAATTATAPKAAAPKAAAPKAAAPAGAQGSVAVNAPMPGKILSVKASAGQAVKKGDVIMILEAMKMENDIVASCDGKITSVLANKGDNVNSGDALATIG